MNEQIPADPKRRIEKELDQFGREMNTRVFKELFEAKLGYFPIDELDPGLRVELELLKPGAENELPIKRTLKGNVCFNKAIEFTDDSNTTKPIRGRLIIGSLANELNEVTGEVEYNLWPFRVYPRKKIGLYSESDFNPDDKHDEPDLDDALVPGYIFQAMWIEGIQIF
jgi:hypothetical protein